LGKGNLQPATAAWFHRQIKKLALLNWNMNSQNDFDFSL
jgi:hypothetical protein